jgi:hypothetical protein
LGGDAVIRQAISCDICGTEKKQTNHWFVAYDQGGELRVSGWSSRNRLRPGSKHLCGQTCLHKLVDEFMARAISTKPQQTAAEELEYEVRPVARNTDASLTSNAAYEARLPYEEDESEARLIPPPVTMVPKRPVVRVPQAAAENELPAPRLAIEPPAHPVAVPPAPAPAFSSRNWRAEAWERERERELRAVGRPAEVAARRRSNA